MLVADMHQRVAAIAQLDAAARRFGEIDEIVISVGERERRFQHEHIVVTPVNADVGAQPFAQQLFRLRVIKGHRTSPARDAARSGPGRRDLQSSRRAPLPGSCIDPSLRRDRRLSCPRTSPRPWHGECDSDTGSRHVRGSRQRIAPDPDFVQAGEEGARDLVGHAIVR